jgi:general secretion pathway protein D
LKISYLTTKVFAIDYILSQRISQGSTDITLSSAATSSGNSTGKDSGTSDIQTESGIKIKSNDEVKFWEALDIEFQSILNRPHDIYKADLPIINKNAGLITVTASIQQIKRFEKYLKRLQEKVHLQVLIDVQILLVTLKEGSSTGIDWSQLYKLQNATFAANYISSTNVNELSISSGISLNEVVKFLQTQGDVSALSNPKVLTLNNQPALITVGTEFYYKIKKTETLASGTSGTQSENEEVRSVFSGILLDITPEISEDKTITLKINPSISEINGIIPIDPITGEATMPPNLDRRQLSSVVTVKDGKRIILGGLINVKKTHDVNQIPLLGSIPYLGYLFKYEEISKQTQELVLIVEPHIIDKESSNISLKDLGYKGIIKVIEEMKHDENEVEIQK